MTGSGRSSTRARSKRLLAGVPHGERLTDREWDVLELLREGQSTAQIAERLAIALVTVRRHVSEILRKLRVTDRAAAVRMLEERENE